MYSTTGNHSLLLDRYVHNSSVVMIESAYFSGKTIYLTLVDNILRVRSNAPLLLFTIAPVFSFVRALCEITILVLERVPPVCAFEIVNVFKTKV